MLKKDIIDNMKHIVENCMGDSEPGCVSTCPMHTDAKGYINLIGKGKGKEAIKLIREKLFIPGTLGRVCPHSCETKCKWSENKSPMAIASLKRYAADNFDDEKDWDLHKDSDKNKKVCVIGAGPSGLQSALDLVRRGYDVTVIEALPVRGGMMAVGIPEYRLPRDVLEKEISYLDKLGVVFKLNTTVGKDISYDEILDTYDAVVVAVGKHAGRVDKSLKYYDDKRVFSAKEYLKEASLHRAVKNVGKRVLVVGGGDVSMDCARVSLRLEGVENVYSICLEDSFDTMPSSHHETGGALDEGVIFNHAMAIKEIKKSNDEISGVVLKRCVSMFDENGNFSPKFDENDTKELDVDTIVFAIGQGVDDNFSNGALEKRPNTTFECDKNTLQSSTNEKVFIAGDASGESSVIVKAMATGVRASESVHRFLQGISLTENRQIEDTSSYETKLHLDVDWSEINETRVGMEEMKPKERIKSFSEVALGYTKEQAEEEANRCRSCECKRCMPECIMLNDYTDCPKTLFKQYLEKGYENMDKMIAFSCNECDQCTIKCPKEFDIKANFMAIKEQYNVDNGNINVIDSLKPFDKSQDMECDEKYCTTVLARKNHKTKYLFVPGCTVPAYGPDLMGLTLEHLRNELDGEVGAMLQCCGKVTKLIGEQEKFVKRNKKAVDIIDTTNADVIITICPSCYKIYKQTSDVPVISYWELMKNEIGIPEYQKGIGKTSDIVFNFHDPCVTRNVTEHHKSVRWIMDELGYKYDEIERNGKNTRCCGVGGMVCSSNPELYKRVYTRRAGDFSSDHIVNYCGSCRATMEASGKDAIHILNLLFEDTYTKSKARERGYKTEDEMWENRLKTKAVLMKLM